MPANKKTTFISALILTLLSSSLAAYTLTFPSKAGSEEADKILSLNENEQISVETERKFLVDFKLIPKKYLDLADIYEIKQTYISQEPEIRVRQVSHNTSSYFFFTLKKPRDSIGLSRSELEFEISRNVYNDLLKKGIGSTIHKTRLQFKLEKTEISVDVYHTNSLSGLSVVEVEFKSIEDSKKFTPPDWFGKDVTTDKRYKNINLSIKGKPKQVEH